MRVILYDILYFSLLVVPTGGAELTMETSRGAVPETTWKQMRVILYDILYFSLLVVPTGGAELTMGTSGFLLGGVLMRRLKLPTAGLYKLLLAIITLCVLLVVVLMFIGCPQQRLLGSPGYIGGG